MEHSPAFSLAGEPMGNETLAGRAKVQAVVRKEVAAKDWRDLETKLRKISDDDYLKAYREMK